MSLNLEEIKRATELLKTIAEDRSQLVGIPEEVRVALLAAAGRVSMPERTDIDRLGKAVRKRRGQDKRDHDKAARKEAGIREAREKAVYVAPQFQLPEHRVEPKEAPLLEIPRDCYVCKIEYRKLHHFYDSMCWECGEKNYAKRFQTADLRGQVALITGGRVKIGFQTAMMMLRAGASVIVTTRFPHDSAQRFARAPDFEQFRERLQIHGLDLRHAPSVEIFAQHIAATHDRLDILINNAAQTVRRPPGFYRHLLELETRSIDSIPKEEQRLLTGHLDVLNRLRPGHASEGSALQASWRSGDAGIGIHSAAALSLVPYDLEHAADNATLFPEGKLDADLQQVDLREINSWRLTLSQVDTAEMLEVHLVNAVAPFILCSKLKGLMLRDRSSAGHIVNVSAMEGSFSRGTKTDKHPHTNMAKAALNMLTLTSSKDYAKSKIYMNAVDTGWVTDEDPAHHAIRKQEERDFHPPLDIVDGAARVIDPVFEATRTGLYPFGQFFKDYAPTKW